MARYCWLLPPVALTLIILFALALEPNPAGLGTHQALGLPPCLFLALTGWPCPSCGLTTSFCHLVRFEFFEACNAHPLGPVLFLSLVLVACGSILEFLGRSTPVNGFLKGRHAGWVYSGLVVYLGFWAGRLLWIHG